MRSKLIYVADARMPTEKAHGLQIAKMCDAFARNINVELILPVRLQSKKLRAKTIPEYYGLKNRLAIKRLFSFNLTPVLGSWLSEHTQALQSLLFPFNKLFFGFVSSIYCLIKRPRYIYTRNFIDCIALWFFHGRKVFYEEHEFSSTKLGIWLKKYILKKIGGVICINRELGRKFYNLNVPNIVVPNGVEILPLPKERARLAAPPHKYSIGYVGRLLEPKGVFTLAEALRHLPDCLLYLIGGISQEVNNFIAFINSREIKNIRVMGYMKPLEARRRMMQFDILVLPYSAKDITHREYISPLKMFEYMASRRPIVATDIPTLREILTDIDAIFVEADNSADMASGIKYLLNHPQIGNKLATNAYEKAKRYTWANRATNILRYMEGGRHADRAR